jgi:hypothetical protein
MPELLQNNPSSTATEANGASQAGDYAGDHLARLYSPTIEEPWFRSLFRNIQEAIHPPVLPPLQVTSKPVAVRDIWGLYGKDKKSNLFSLAIHGTVVLLLFTVASSKAVQQKAKEVINWPTLISLPYVPKMAEQKQQMQGGGGGGDRSLTRPARAGAKPSMKQFTPPGGGEQPQSQVSDGSHNYCPPDTPLPNVNMPVWGDPLANWAAIERNRFRRRYWRGSGGGVGSGKGGGFGPGEAAASAAACSAWAAFRLWWCSTSRSGIFRGSPQGQVFWNRGVAIGGGPYGQSAQHRVVRSLGLGLMRKLSKP